mmetsp:Transcript_27812/g.36469  ORF Transcript_27812/g.36469 Transcript_27812/m.36469 type:complete len:362 (-) Transcript_27812:294-1379(-)
MPVLQIFTATTEKISGHFYKLNLNQLRTAGYFAEEKQGGILKICAVAAGVGLTVAIGRKCISKMKSNEKHGAKGDEARNSAIFEGRIYHSRFHPTRHCFNYPIFFCFLDLSEIENCPQPLHWPIFSTKFPALARFRLSDHLKGKSGICKLSDGIRDLVFSKTGKRPKGRICLLTHLSYYGYCFNPVSFYYIYNEEDTQVETIVGEVSNTPWGEMHCYVLNPANSEMVCQEHTAKKQVYRFQKEFHVSPFMDMQHDYFWRFGPPGESLWVKNGMIKKGETWFDAHLQMSRQPFTTWNLCKHLLKYPFYTVQVQLIIHYEAFKLWMKEVPFYPHPEGSETAASKIIALFMAPLFKLQEKMIIP